MESDYFKNRNAGVIFSILLVAIGAIFYFAVLEPENMGKDDMSAGDYSLLEGIQMKAAYTPDGQIKVFALAQNNNLKNYTAEMGNNLPEQSSMVIGSAEAAMMIEEGLFEKEGDKIDGLFGINTEIEGVLKETGTFADDFHFLSSEQYAQLEGESGLLSIKYTPDGTAKLFYVYDKNSNSQNKPSAEISFKEGSMDLFVKHTINKEVYYPVIIGSKEAEMMIDEGLIQKTGDTLDDFFGRKAIIVGIAEETGTALDMMHIVERDFSANTSIINTANLAK